MNVEQLAHILRIEATNHTTIFASLFIPVLNEYARYGVRFSS